MPCPFWERSVGCHPFSKNSLPGGHGRIAPQTKPIASIGIDCAGFRHLGENAKAELEARPEGGWTPAKPLHSINSPLALQGPSAAGGGELITRDTVAAGLIKTFDASGIEAGADVQQVCVRALLAQICEKVQRILSSIASKLHPARICSGRIHHKNEKGKGRLHHRQGEG